MLLRLRRFLDLRPGEGLPVLLSFLYVGVVAASFLLARPIRNSLFLRQYGPYALVYVYAAVPLVLSVFVPIYTRITVRFGSRAVTVATLVFFSSNVLLFWYVQPRPHLDHAGRVLRLGQLFRRDRAGAGLELRQFALRHPPGQAALRADRRRRVARGDRRRLRGALPGAPRRRHGQHDDRPRRAHPDRRRDRHVRESSPPPARPHRPVAPGEAPVPGEPESDPGQPLSPVDGGDGVSHRDRHAVDGVPVELCGERLLQGERRRADAILRDVQPDRRLGRVPAATARDRPRAAAIRADRDDSRAPALARPRDAVDSAVGGVLARLHHQRLRSGVPLLDRQGHLRAALSAAAVEPPHPPQERDRHRHRAVRRRLRRSAARADDRGVLERFGAPDSACAEPLQSISSSSARGLPWRGA